MRRSLGTIGLVLLALGPEARGADPVKDFVYEKRDRGHQRSRVIEVDTSSASVRVLIDEQANTFIDHYHKHYRRMLGDIKQVLKPIFTEFVFGKSRYGQ